MKSAILSLAAAALVVGWSGGTPAFAQGQGYQQQPPPPSGYAPAAAQGPFGHHSGVMVGVGIGMGSVSCDGCETSEIEVAFDFHLGGFVSPQLAIMWDYGGLVDSEGDLTAVLASHTAAAQYWVAPKVWIKGGLGVAQAYVSFGSESDSEFGVAGLVGGGYDIMQSNNFVLDVSARLSFLDFDELNTNLTMITGIIGARWR